MPLELKKSIITRALNTFKELEVATPKEAAECIRAFPNIPEFKELKILDLYIYLSYSYLVSSKTIIRKYYSSEYKNSEINPSYKAIKGYSLGVS